MRSIAMPVHFRLSAQMPSGKNQVQLLWRQGRVHKYPNQRFVRWRREAAAEIHQQVQLRGMPYAQPVRLLCDYVPHDRRTRDVPGLEDALLHLLVYAGLLADDGLAYDCLWARGTTGKPGLSVEVLPWPQP